MQWFQTPEGEAGSDQLDAMEESIQAAIEQMFSQVAKRDSLSFGVGRVTVKSSSDPNWDMRLDAQRRECDGLIVFHAGKALETSLQIIYARVNNRIPGREYPGVSSERMKRDRKSHRLTDLYSDILTSVETRPKLRAQFENEFESIFQTVFHEGIQDLIVDDALVHRFFLIEDAPFRETRIEGLRQNAEITMDHTRVSELLNPSKGASDFARLPCTNFQEFLVKTDAAYYGQRNMRWAHYSARDHERGRLYVAVGTRFFARLAKGLVAMANEQWMWDRRLARRWHERRRAIVGDVVRHHIQQSFRGDAELPEMKSVDEMQELFRSLRSARTDQYEWLHRRWNLHRSSQACDIDQT